MAISINIFNLVKDDIISFEKLNRYNKINLKFIMVII